MYRDIIEAPVQFEVNDVWYWYQVFNHLDGSFEVVRLYDADGDFICEFDSLEEMYEFIEGVC